MALTAEEKTLLKKKQASLTDEDFLTMDETEFRARFRERVHHTLEIQTYSHAYRKKTLSQTQADYAKRLCGLWIQRELPTSGPEYVYAQTLIGLADQLANGDPIDLAPYSSATVTPEEEAIFLRLLMDRRSVREFTQEVVPDALVDKVLNAGLWAAHACNLQSIRYLVIREDKAPGLFSGSDVPGGPLHLVICQDMRCYLANQFMPDRNILLDAGAAGQNLVLAAHAVGLEGVWLTFNDTIKARLKNHFNLPDYISIVTYVDVGFGDQTPRAPLRHSVDACVIGRTPL